VKKYPNILLIINDHQAYYRHGWDGGVRPKTPNFDRMALEGIRFERAYTPCALCVPARRSILTGLFPHNHGLITNDELIQEKNSDLFFQHLTEKGYSNYYFGKWHNGPMHLWEQGCSGFSLPGYGNPYATDEYKEYCEKYGISEAKCLVENSFVKEIDVGQEYLMRDIGTHPRASGILLTPSESHEAFFLTTLACEKLEQLQGNEDPWCMIVSYWGPHRPYFPSTEYAEMYTPETILPYGNYYDCLENKPESYKYEHNKGLHNGDGNMIIPNPIPWEIWQKDLACCYAHISLVDAAGGMLLDKLEQLSMSKDTLVIWTADHGDGVASHGGHATKGPFMSEELYRIPFAVRWTGEINPCQTSSCLISSLDIAPTILDVAKTGFNRQVDGQSLLDIFRGRMDYLRDSQMCEFNGLHEPGYFGRMLLTDRFAYVATQNDIDELYDLYKDPYRLVNLADNKEMSVLRDELRAKLFEWVEKTGDFFPVD
jgi:arylsulfatase A-like enzyme